MIKEIIGFSASMGVGQVVNNVVKATIPNDLNKMQKVFTSIGAAALGGLLGKLAADEIENQLGGLEGLFKGVVSEQEGE